MLVGSPLKGQTQGLEELRVPEGLVVYTKVHLVAPVAAEGVAGLLGPVLQKVL